jgi:hypothetical protein
MMDHCDKCMKAAKDAMGGDEPEEGKEEADKALTAKIDGLEKAFADLSAKIAATPAVQPPATGAGGPQLVEKNSATADFAELISK